ncbi:VanW family protein [Klenkia brasiliensis]|uniref:Vancomycin resistance protein YoaR, contains peptidoglycan-binding and VanW domains n=1 Tax=Klenkia brasiliensis TaxID=333142 RepID=A0A1G7T6P7_9ACTN|nr:VanW family protein [Klenkia brasiliensis]SDG30966.1 Vancomycin resistance protein YoaR, contains peptidoglycan-binding and VanW domains [Klenkia brasiliensis]
MSDETPRRDSDPRPEGETPVGDDRTARLQPDGTVGSGRPSAPPAAERPRPVAPGWGDQTPVAPAGQPLPVNPRRRAADAGTPDPLPVDQTPTGELRAGARPEEPDSTQVIGAVPAADDPAAEPDQRATAEQADEPADDDEPHDDDAHGTGADDRGDDDVADVEQTAEVPAAVVPRDVFDDPAPTTVAAPPAHPDGSPDPLVGPADGSAGSGRSRWRRPAVLVPAAVLLALGVAYAVDLAVAGDDVPRNTVVAGVDIGGLSPAAASQALAEQLAPRVTADHVLVADDVQGVLSPATAGITLDVDSTVRAASGQPLNPWTRLVSVFSERDVTPVITGEETALAAQVDAFAETVDRAPVDATIALEGTTATVVPAVTGRLLDREAAGEAVTEALASGGDPQTPIELPVETVDVQVEDSAAQQALDEVVTPAVAAPVTVSGDDGTSAELSPEGIAAALRFAAGDGGALDVSLDPAALQTALGDQLGEFGTPAQDARFQITGDTIAVVPSVDGTGIDPAALASSLRPVLTEPAPRAVTASLGAVPAEFTTDEANALGIVEPISSFTTNFTNSASGTNIRVVAEFVDGAVVLPGETFSLNGYTGPRGEAQGYVPAGVINNGEFTQAVGGGISQFATTMFNAVFFAGLEDVYHKPHSYYISRYPAGREATVYYDSIDLQWRNDSPTGVYVQTQWVPGALTVTFWGTQRYDVESVSSDRYNVRTPVVQEKPDDGNCNPQAGANGFDITVTRIFKDPTTGEQLRTEDFDTRYAAEPVIRCVPVAPAAPESTAPGAPAQPTGRRPRRT